MQPLKEFRPGSDKIKFEICRVGSSVLQEEGLEDDRPEVGRSQRELLNSRALNIDLSQDSV